MIFSKYLKKILGLANLVHQFDSGWVIGSNSKALMYSILNFINQNLNSSRIKFLIKCQNYYPFAFEKLK